MSLTHGVGRFDQFVNRSRQTVCHEKCYEERSGGHKRGQQQELDDNILLIIQKGLLQNANVECGRASYSMDYSSQ